MVGYALFGVFVETGYQGSIKAFRDCLRSDESLTVTMGAATVNRISAMLKSGMTPTVYDQRWIPLLNAIDANQALNGQETSDPKDESEWPLEYSTFRIFTEVIGPIFGVCDSVAKNSWVAQMCQARADDIHRLRAECRDIALTMLAASDAIPSVRTEILRNELKRRISDPLQALTGESKGELQEFAKSVVIDSSFVAAILSVFTGFDPRTTAVGAASAAVASIGRRMLASSSTPGHLSLLRDGLVATEKQYAEIRQHLLALTLPEVSAK